MNRKPITLARRLTAFAVAAFVALALSAGGAPAQKPDFAGSAAEKGGRGDAAKEHAGERGKGKKKGLDKEAGDKGDDDKKGKKEKKAKKDKKGKGK